MSRNKRRHYGPSGANNWKRQKSPGTNQNHHPPVQKLCIICGTSKPKAEFNKTQWSKDPRRCKACANVKLICSSCKNDVSPSGYDKEELLSAGDNRRCSHCIKIFEYPTCRICKRSQKRDQYKEEDIENDGHGHAKTCIECFKYPVCGTCKSKHPRKDYTPEELEKDKDSRICSRCHNFPKCGLCQSERPRHEYKQLEELDEHTKGQKLICIQCQSCPVCARCKTKKLFSCFGHEELQKGESSKCNDCVEILLQKKREKQKQTAIFGAEQVKMHTFEVPGRAPVWMDDDSDDEEGGDDEDDEAKTPSLSFGNLNLQRLLHVGRYDLVFFSTETDEPDLFISRATRGTIAFSPTDNVNCLKAIVCFDKSVRADLQFHHVDFEMEVKNDGDDLCLEVTNVDMGGYDITGKVKLINKRQAVRFMPESHESWNYAIGKTFARTIHFNTNEQAEKLLQEYESGERLLWLENHMNMPQDVSRTIHQYLSEKPQPVFFFEENDIHINIDWDDGDFRDGYFSTCLVARPRQISL